METAIIKSVVRYQFPVLLLAVWLPLASFGQPANEPSSEQLQRELQFHILTMWKVTGFTVQDAFREETDNGEFWKARFHADIETTEPTYVPTDLEVGAVTIVRPAYPAGVKRQLSGRVTAEPLPSGNWTLQFLLDNRPTLTAGLPLRYFVGRVVIAGSKEHAGLVESIQEERVKLAVQKHEAALKTLRMQHDAELRRVRGELEQADDLEQLRSELEQRVDTLRHSLALLQDSADSLATAAASQGLTMSQWAEKGFDSTVAGRRDSTAAELVGAPDVENCDPKRRAANAWFVGAHEKGEQKVTVSFLEPVIPTEVVIFETAGTGFVTSLEFADSRRQQTFSEEVIDVSTGCAAEAVFPIVGITTPVNQITVTIDASREGNKAIDAIRLTGMKPSE